MTSERKFHWRLTQGGERHGASRGFQASLADTGKPDLDQRIRFCRRAEELGINTPFTAPDRDFPELFIAGNSTQARDLAVSQGTIWMQIPNTPEAMRERGADVLAAGKELGVRCSIIGGRTRGEALRKAYALISESRDGFDDGAKERAFMGRGDSVK